MSGTAIQPIKRVLSNSAAEFIEAGAGRSVVAEAVGSNRKTDLNEAEFASELDRFVPPGDPASLKNAYSLSAEHSKKFQFTLRQFCDTLKRREIEKNLGIVLKDPKDYQIRDAIDIAGRLQDAREAPENTRAHMRYIRTFFRHTEKHKSTLSTMIKFVPNDSYGCVLTGGFTLILAAIFHHEALRREVQEILADIPRKLDNVQRMSELHWQSSNIHSIADAVFISIFSVLERIIDRLSHSLGERLLSKAKGHTNDIKEAVRDLDTNLIRFQEEVEICAQQRFGRIESRQIATESALREVIKRLDEQPNVAFLNAFYKFVTSAPSFNCIDGTVIPDHLLESRWKRKMEEDPHASPGADNSASRTASNELVIAKWLKRRKLKKETLQSSEDIADATEDISSLSIKDQDRMQWIMTSKEFNEWLTDPRSLFLLIEMETSPDTTVNPITCTTAFTCDLIIATRLYPVTSFYWGFRSHRFFQTTMWPAMLMLNAFNLQLLEFIRRERPSHDLSFVSEDQLLRKSQVKVARGLELFRRLLTLLNGNSHSIFIFVDQLSLVPKIRNEVQSTLNSVMEIGMAFPELTCKVIVTDPLADFAIRPDIFIHVPDLVDGDRTGFNTKFASKELIAALKVLKGVKETREAESSDETDSNSSTEAEENACDEDESDEHTIENHRQPWRREDVWSTDASDENL